MRTAALVSVLFLGGLLLGSQFLLAPTAVRLAIVGFVCALGVAAVAGDIGDLED